MYYTKPPYCFVSWFLLMGILLLTGCRQGAHQEPISLTGKAQGTFYSIIYYDAQARNMQQEIDSILDAFDMSCSLWKEESLLRRINRGETDSLDYILERMFNYSKQINTYSNGAFDCAIGELIRTWGFAFDSMQDVTPERISELQDKAAVSRNYSIVKQDSLVHLVYHKGSEYNFNAIAQGLVVDIIANFFQKNDIDQYLINVGGEIIAHGTKPNGKHWKVGIEKPAKDKDSNPEVELAIRLDNMSVVTSGSYRKYYEKDGTRISHTIDPTTGYPVTHTLLSVSVVSKESWYADAMATAFMVMGLEKSLKFITDHPEDPDIQSVFFIFDDKGEYKTYATPPFEKLIQR